MPVLSPRETPLPAVAIVGGGFTGAAAAIALLTRYDAPFSLFIIEPSASIGSGVAYGDARRRDLLNVRAEDMRLRADLPNDFFTWLLAEDLFDPEACAGSYYAPRRTFGAYVGGRFAIAKAARPDVVVRHLRTSAEEISRGQDSRFSLALANGAVVDADAVVLATGYGLPRPPRFGYGAYEEIAQPVLRRARSAAIVGTGLSAIDAALHLSQAAPHIKLRLISRRGLRPLAQHAGPSLSSPWPETFPRTAAGALRAVRRRVLDAAAEGKDWRAVLNGFRPVTQDIWSGFSESEKRRFARHLKPYWDALRHRMPSKTAARISDLEKDGRLTVERGAVSVNDEGEIVLRRFGASAPTPLDDDIVIDCTGHGPDLAASAIQSLFANGLAFPDALGIGVAVEKDGQVLNRNEEQSVGLFALGPLGAGSLLEITASLEIAAQAALAAESIADLLPSRPPSDLRVPAHAGGAELRR